MLLRLRSFPTLQSEKTAYYATPPKSQPAGSVVERDVEVFVRGAGTKQEKAHAGGQAVTRSHTGLGPWYTPCGSRAERLGFGALIFGPNCT